MTSETKHDEVARKEWEYWTRELVEADNQRREADRRFQMVMMRLRGLTPGGHPIVPEGANGEEEGQ